MLLHLLKTALRNLRRHKGFSFINVFGLALAMSVSMLIILMLADQKIYDQFHTNKDRIYRILTDKPNSGMSSAVTSFPLAPTLRADYPAVEAATHLHLGVGGEATYDNKAVELRGYFADPSFFKVFSYTMDGNKENALMLPHTMVISRQAAIHLFADENPLGKTVAFVDRGLNILRGVGVEAPATEWGTFQITGVIDTENLKSHLKFDVLISSATLASQIAEKKRTDLTDVWLEHNVGYTYTLLARGKSENELIFALQDIVARKYAGIDNAKGLRLTPQRLTSITPGIFVSSPSSFLLPIQAYYFLSFLAATIMLSACLNYTNLSTARSLTRAKEIGVRKTAGANRSSLVLQFLTESILISLFALAFAFGLTLFIKPVFKGFWVNQYLMFDLAGNALVYGIFFVFAVLVGCLAGIYPAFKLARFHPITALKDSTRIGVGKLTLQKVLSTSQFVISLLFITTSVLVFNQFKHHLELEYGLNPTSIINVSLQDASYERVINELGSVAGVLSVSASDKIPGSGQGTNGVGLKLSGTDGPEKACDQFVVDDQFINNLEISLIAGRNLPKEASGAHILVNETAAKELGFASPLDIVGQVFQSTYGTEFEVIGVVKNFRFRMPTEEDNIGPMILRHETSQFRYAQIKVNSNGMTETLATLEAKWKTIDPLHPFKYQFYDEQLKSMNKGFIDIISILGFIAFLAVTIACLGLLGMTTYMAERRKKEVGIRKVLGAGEWAIAVLLSKGFLRILFVAVAIGAPLSYFGNNLWLQNFPNRVEFGWGTLLIGIVTLSVLGLITIGSQVIGASRRNPVHILKTE